MALAELGPLTPQAEKQHHHCGPQKRGAVPTFGDADWLMMRVGFGMGRIGPLVEPGAVYPMDWVQCREEDWW
jgi:hypothetical protein